MGHREPVTSTEDLAKALSEVFRVEGLRVQARGFRSWVAGHMGCDMALIRL